VELTSVGVGLLVLRKRAASRASQWVDRRFFRESYDAEKVLTELAAQVGRYVQIQPLLETVAVRISNTLHTPDMVILIQEGSSFVARYSTRAGQPMNIDAAGNIANTLREHNDALEIYFDKPPLWLRSLTAEELQTLDFMRTQVLLPLCASDRLTGMMSLGPKLSEEPYTDTDIRLLKAIASQMGLAIENSRLVASLAAEAAAREIANRELEIAREVQERLFPQNDPSIAGLDCAGYCRPARGVGGDYYDFLKLDDGRLGIAIGDVSGKGIAAALLMASLQASLRGQAAAGVHDLSSLMHNVNKLVYEASTSNRYATFFYGEYAALTRRFSFVNAGHNPPLILRGGEVLRLEADGPVVGLLPGARYGQSECTLQAGDIFIAFTDGISEALNEREEEWEEERFIAAARACQGMSAKEMIRAIFRAADDFTGSAKQYDDMTLLVMKLA
jgi:sigma-B regulation protein RsbU (phosphoserine phosphatase)